MKKFKRVYHPVDDWEEIEFNMWGSVDCVKSALKDAIKFTGNYKLYGDYMFKVITRWPISCENALTDYSLNRKAWIGHAAAAMALKIPENITRKAWRYLGHEQQYLANEQASRAIRAWENNYIKSSKLHKNMESQMLF